MFYVRNASSKNIYKCLWGDTMLAINKDSYLAAFRYDSYEKTNAVLQFIEDKEPSERDNFYINDEGVLCHHVGMRGGFDRTILIYPHYYILCTNTVGVIEVDINKAEKQFSFID